MNSLNSNNHSEQADHAFALSVKHALNDSAQNLPRATLGKLYLARRQAINSHKKAYAKGSVASFFNVLQMAGVASVSRAAKPLAFALPVLVMGVALYGMSSDNAENYVQTVAEIDSQVLTQELPINALLDKGFVQYVQVGE
jgi:hypothetical protein